MSFDPYFPPKTPNFTPRNVFPMENILRSSTNIRCTIVAAKDSYDTDPCLLQHIGGMSI